MGWKRRQPEPPADDVSPPADPENVARTILLRRLEAAPRTRAQLAASLQERDVPSDVASRVLDRFEDVGLIDDRVFAAMWVESRQRTRNLSRRALHNELRLRGVADELVSEALDSLDAEGELAAARRVASRKARSVVGLPRQTQYRRIAGALARKGYGASLARQVTNEVLDCDEELTTGADDCDGPW